MTLAAFYAITLTMKIKISFAWAVKQPIIIFTRQILKQVHCYFLLKKVIRTKKMVQMTSLKI